MGRVRVLERGGGGLFRIVNEGESFDLVKRVSWIWFLCRIVG